MVDLHCHLLPSLDDGPATDEEALELARRMVGDGVGTVVAVPHLRYNGSQISLDKVGATADRLQARILSEGLDLSIVVGTELPLIDAASMNKQELAAHSIGRRGRYVLTEPTPMTPIRNVEEALYHVRLMGFQPILAHPERVIAYQRHPRDLEGVVHTGSLVQLGARALLGHEGPEVEQACRAMLKSGLVHSVASDSHNCDGRYGDLAEARRLLARLVGKSGALRLVLDNPSAVLEGWDALSIAPVAPAPKILRLF